MDTDRTPTAASPIEDAAAKSTPGPEREARHRNDIDGLRAIAVLAVLVFHLGFSPRFAGGFVGVDVFFVISGYLITGIVDAEIEAGKFSVVGFYNRRVRRIFPALFLVYAFCLVASVGLLFPTDVANVGHELRSSVAFVSNIVYAHADGYFDEASSTSLLLHTWSLSVEEQFYIGLPLLMMALARVGKRVRLGVLVALAVASFLACVKVVGVDQRRAFYFVHFRAWELLAGALLALGLLPRLRSRVLAECLGVTGLGLIVYSVLRIDGSLAFPGFWALPPCLGALLLLYSGSAMPTLVASLLGSLPLRSVGLISYSLYLWHWPLIAIHNLRFDEMTSGHRWLLLAAALVLSTLSYRYVEQPFRRKPYARSPRATLLIAGASMLAVSAFAFATPAVARRLRPRSALADIALSYSEEVNTRSGQCFLNSGYDDFALFRKDLCLALDPKRRNFLVLGDSHAANFTPALAALHPEINFLQATASGCQATQKSVGAKRCTQLFTYVFDDFLRNNRVDTVILAGHWPASTLSTLVKTAAYLRKRKMRAVVLGPVVEYRQPLPQLLARSILQEEPDLPSRHRRAAPLATDRKFAARLRAAKVEYYSVYDATCPDGVCTLWATPRVPMQSDRSHLTPSGARLVLKRLGPSLFR